MTDKEIIEKTTKALKALELYGEYDSILVTRITDEMFLEMDPELKNKYSVVFSYKLPDGRMAGTSVSVDNKTNKLLNITTKSGLYKVPEELQ